MASVKSGRERGLKHEKQEKKDSNRQLSKGRQKC